MLCLELISLHVIDELLSKLFYKRTEKLIFLLLSRDSFLIPHGIFKYRHRRDLLNNVQISFGDAKYHTEASIKVINEEVTLTFKSLAQIVIEEYKGLILYLLSRVNKELLAQRLNTLFEAYICTHWLTSSVDTVITQKSPIPLHKYNSRIMDDISKINLNDNHIIIKCIIMTRANGFDSELFIYDKQQQKFVQHIEGFPMDGRSPFYYENTFYAINAFLESKYITMDDKQIYYNNPLTYCSFSIKKNYRSFQTLYKQYYKVYITPYDLSSYKFLESW